MTLWDLWRVSVGHGILDGFWGQRRPQVINLLTLACKCGCIDKSILRTRSLKERLENDFGFLEEGRNVVKHRQTCRIENGLGILAEIRTS